MGDDHNTGAPGSPPGHGAETKLPAGTFALTTTTQSDKKNGDINMNDIDRLKGDRVGGLEDAKMIDKDDDEITLPLILPPDGGWGWAIAIACFFTNLIVDGVCYTFAVIFTELLDEFEAGKGQTALVGALVPGCYLLVGPIVGALANRFGCRIVTMIGSVIAAAAFVVSAFSVNINMMLVTYGVTGGVGFGLMYLPSIVMVGHYFDKKRALATGISVCGSGLGTFVFAPLGSALVREYGWKGANIIIGAIILNGIVFGAIFRPLDEHSTKRRKDIPPSKIMASIAADKRIRAISVGSIDGHMITMTDDVVLDVTSPKQSSGPTLKIPGMGNQLIPAITVTGVEGSTTNVAGIGGSSVSLRIRRPSRVGLAGEMASQRSIAQVKKELASPFARKDVLYGGSVMNLNEYEKKADKDMTTYVQNVTELPPEDESKIKRLFRLTMDMFNFALLKSITFIIVCASGVFVFVGLYTPFVYVTEKAVTQLDVSPEKASTILAILGICSTVSRLIVGWVADRKWIDTLLIHNVSAIIAGVATALVSILNSYELLCAYAAVFGASVACFIALRSIVIVEMLGIEKLNNAFGLTSLFQGIAVLVGSPLSGALVDLTGSFVTSFVVCGSLIAFGGILCLPIRKVAAWEEGKAKKR